jgi:serine protease inhibitor
MKPIYLLLLLLFVGISCIRKNKNQNTNKKFQPITLSTDQKELVQANNQIAFTLFIKACSDEAKENLLYSPLSVSMALSMVMNGAKGTTKTGMLKTLGFGKVENSKVNEFYKLMIQQLQHADDQVVLNIANSIWYRNTFPFSTSFLSTNLNYYNAFISPLDFSSPSATKTINSWVSTKTNNEIPTIIDNILPDQVMLLINAIYFKGLWRKQYDASKTTDQDFYCENKKVVKCKMMTQEEVYFPFYSNKIFTAVEMSYGHANFVMTVLLPNDGKTTSDVIGNITAESWKSMNDSLDFEEVTLNMPRFKISYETSLNSMLGAMGMADAFNPKVANFNSIYSHGGIYISEMKHKTTINVDEKGTVAAAVTADQYVTLAIPKIVNINKPFIFVISEKSTGTILFTGRIMDPTKE